jgi:hypothetical protein
MKARHEIKSVSSRGGAIAAAGPWERQNPAALAHKPVPFVAQRH